MKNYYVIKARKNGKEVFYCIDRHSGGHPYWSNFSPEKYYDLDNAKMIVELLKEDYKNTINLESIEIVMIGEIKVVERIEFKDKS